MQLRQIEIQNFRAIRQQSFSFTDAMNRVRPVTVLAGPNGCGKTTVLFAIYRALSGAMGYHSDDVTEASDEEIYSEREAGGWSLQPRRVTIRLILEYPQDERDAAQPILDATRILQKPRQNGLMKLPTLADGRLTVTWRYPPDQRPDGSFKPRAFVHSELPGGASWLGLPKLAIRGWRHRPRALVELDLLDRVGILRMFAQNRGKRWVASEEREAFPTDTTDTNADEPITRIKRPVVSVSSILKVLADAAHGRRANSDQEKENVEQTVREMFGRICSPKRYVGYVYGPNDIVGTPLLEDGDRQYPLSMAATGEQVILDYLTQFAYPRPVNNSLILIDEPELHLHPRWIRQLYRALPKMGRGNQFIMTTHSSELRQLAAEDNALLDLGKLDEFAESAIRA
jgi:energy-coupling factor transporter ATP-binding protein EcfA2